MREPLVSVIIPVYNVKEYLAKALDSTINQSYKNLEIIVIDDGSTDGCSEICDLYAAKDKRIQVIHQQNKGLSCARNAGLDMMHGEMVCFLDPDDSFHLDFVKELYTALREQDADISICKYTTESKLEKQRFPLILISSIEPQIKPGTYNRIQALNNLADNIINVSVWNKLYKSSLWNTIRFPDRHNYEDLDTSYKVMELCKRVCAIDKVLYFHIRRPQSITCTNTIKNIHDRLRAGLHFKEFIQSKSPEIFSKELSRKWDSKILNSMIIGYIQIDPREKDSKKILNYYKKQIRSYTKRISLKNCRRKTKIALSLFRIHPSLLTIVYRMYIPFRRLVFNTTGK